MATKETLATAIAILEKANQRSKRVRNAIAYLRSQLRNAPHAPVAWHNFHNATRAVFDQVSLERVGAMNRPADFISPSGSMYWRTEQGVYRLSDHWGLGIKSCDWYLRDFRWQKGDGLALGFCRFDHFLREVQREERHYRVFADGREERVIPNTFIRRTEKLRIEVVVEGFHPGYNECCAAKEAN